MAIRNPSKNPYWINEDNFLSSSVIDHRIKKLDDYISLNDSDIAKIFNVLHSSWHDNYWPIFSNSKGKIEDDTKRFIGLVLEEFGFKFLQERQIKGKNSNTFEKPDYALFLNNEDIVVASSAEEEFRFLKSCAFLEAKTFSNNKMNNLDDIQTRSMGTGTKQKCRPVDQLISCMINGKKDWGVLTNGAIWRIYSLKSKNPKSQYLEFNLMDLLQFGEVTEEFKLFYYIFSSEAFHKDEQRLNNTLELSRKYNESLGPEFYKSCIECIKLLFDEITSKKKIKSYKKAEETFNSALLVLYKIVSVRYLEDKGVLPVNAPDYKDIGLDSLRLDIEKIYRSGEYKLLTNKTSNYWERLLTLFNHVNVGDFGVQLEVSAFQSELFDHLDDGIKDITIGDKTFVDALDFLFRGGHDKDSYQIDYYDLGVHRIGDLYDRVLSLKLVENNNSFELVDSNSNKKSFGSYFTSPELTRLMGEQIIEQLKSKYLDRGDYSFSIIDNSVGSGHFLRQLADDVAEYISNSEYNMNSKVPVSKEEALRHVVENCLYGVDINPNSVWLTKLSLWLATTNKYKPFVYIDNNIIVGDSLIASRNENSKDWLSTKAIKENLLKYGSVVTANTEDLIKKKKLWGKISKHTSKFFSTRLDMASLSKRYFDNHFHWEEKFPQIFGVNGGFTIVCGNPPWDTIKPKVPDFYKMITGESKAPVRKKLDVWLKADEKRYKEYKNYEKEQLSYAAYLRSRGYEHQEGEVQTHSYFTEKSLEILAPKGFLSYVIKLGVYTDKFQKKMRELLYEKNTLKSMHIFQKNKLPEGMIFFNVDPNEKFIVFGVQKHRSLENYKFDAKFVKNFAEITNTFEPWMAYQKSKDIDPESKVIEIYEDEQKKKILQQLSKQPTLKEGQIGVFRELDVTIDRKLVTNNKTDIPVYTGESCHHYILKENTLFSTVVDTSRFNGIESEKIVVRNILPNSRRKIYASVVPGNALTQNSLLCLDTSNADMGKEYLLAFLNCLSQEYYIRPKLSNLNLNNFRLEQFRIPAEKTNPYSDAIVEVVTEVSRQGPEFKYDGSSLEAKIEALCMLSFDLDLESVQSVLKYFNCTDEFNENVISYMEQYLKLEEAA